MGNMMPCLVQQGSTIPAAMNPKQRLYSLNVLLKALNKMKKKRSSSRSNKANKIGASKPDEEAASPAAAAAGGGGGGEVGKRKQQLCSKVSLRRRAAGQGGAQRKGVVRVKVVLTKEEAARLLSLTVGGQKSAAQIVAEIKRMEARRRANAAPPAWRPALASIPEEHYSS